MSNVIKSLEDLAIQLQSATQSMLFLPSRQIATLRTASILLQRAPTYNNRTFDLYRTLATMATEPSKYKLNHSM
jgi:hypothetical protein